MISFNINLYPNIPLDTVIYDHLIPHCEEKNIHLSSYGNCTGQGTLVPLENYNEEKQNKKLFNIMQIVKIQNSLHQVVQEGNQYKIGSYGLKHAVEKCDIGYISNGDCIVAMILNGYSARFKKKGENQIDVNCEFKAKYI
jgi:hypothetical protein